jgi:DNA-binding NtrC family response regulator
MLRCQEGFNIPARVVVVHSAQEYLDQVAAALGRAGFDAAAFSDPMPALEALEAAHRIEVLVTCIEFAKGKPNGVALARMARMKRPGLKVLFAALPEFERYAEGLGTFMAAPVTASDIVSAVSRLLESCDLDSD